MWLCIEWYLFSRGWWVGTKSRSRFRQVEYSKSKEINPIPIFKESGTHLLSRVVCEFKHWEPWTGEVIKRCRNGSFWCLWRLILWVYEPASTFRQIYPISLRYLGESKRSKSCQDKKQTHWPFTCFWGFMSKSSCWWKTRQDFSLGQPKMFEHVFFRQSQ